MDESIESLLLPEEIIEYEYNGLFVTNKRIILYDVYTWWGLWENKKFQDIDYKYVSSIEYGETRSNLWLLPLAILLLLFGAFLFVYQDDVTKFVYIGNIVKFIGNDNLQYVVIGLIFIAIWLIFKAFEKKTSLKIITLASYINVKWDPYSKHGDEIMLAIRKHL
jgi:hypothetical protein